MLKPLYYSNAGISFQEILKGSWKEKNSIPTSDNRRRVSAYYLEELIDSKMQPLFIYLPQPSSPTTTSNIYKY